MPHIVVDAGHGGHDSGAQGFGHKEKDINLRVAQKVSARLRKLGFQVTELRPDDTFVGSASERGRKVAEIQPDFAISIHANSSGGTGKFAGAEIIVPLAKSVARFEYPLREKFAELNNFRMIFSKESKTQNLREREINPETLRFTRTYDAIDYYGIIREARKGGVNLDIIEMFYIDNEGDLYTFLNQEDEYVEAIVYALCQAFDMKYSRGRNASDGGESIDIKQSQHEAQRSSFPYSHGNNGVTHLQSYQPLMSSSYGYRTSSYASVYPSIYPALVQSTVHRYPSRRI